MTKLSNSALTGHNGDTGYFACAWDEDTCDVYTHTAESKELITPVQSDDREHVALLMELFKRVRPFLQAGFGAYGRNHNGDAVNRALSCNIRHAILEDGDGHGQGPSILYPRLKVSEGSLPSIHKPNIELSKRSTLTINWADNSGPKGARPVDRFMCLVWCPELQEAVQLTDGFARNRKQHTLKLPLAFAKRTIHIYTAFRNTKGNRVSNSTYIGKVRAKDWKRKKRPAELSMEFAR